MYHNWLKSYQNIGEVRTQVPLRVASGSLPKQLNGTYYKCGPGQFSKFGSQVAHPFDGDGYVSAYRISAGEVTYQSRFIDTKHRQEEERSQRRMYSGAFGTHPYGLIIKNPANTSIIEWGGFLIVFCESGAPYLLDRDTLETIGTLRPFKDGLPIRFGIDVIDDALHGIGIFGDAIGAHPKIFNDVLILYSITYKGGSSVITFYELNKNFEIISLRQHTLENALYFVHDFQVVEDYYIFIEHSVNFNWTQIHRGVVNCLENHPNKPYNVIHAIPRKADGVPAKHEVLPGFVSHYVGLPKEIGHSSLSYEMSSIIYPNLIKWDDMSDMNGGVLFRTQWNLGAKCVKQDRMSHHLYEFPMSAGSVMYSLVVTDDDRRGLSRLEGGMETFWFIEEHMFLGEPMIASGYLIVTCFDSQENASTLLVFDGVCIDQGPLCKIDLPHVTPIGLHGWWSPSKALIQNQL